MWKILGRYKAGKWEVIDEADTEEEAMRLAREYRLAFGEGWEIKVI